MTSSVCRALCGAHPAWALGAASALAVLGASVPALAADCTDGNPWSRLGASGSNFARPLPLTMTALAVVTPFGFAATGLDQRARLLAQRDLHGRPNLEPVSVWAPYVLGGGLFIAYAISTAVGSCGGKQHVLPILQAGVVTYVGVGFLKLAVGRRFPNGGRDPNAPDRLHHPEGAHDFAPFRRGFGAWPSGHTALMFAGASALRASSPELGWASFLGYPVALGVASGMWLGDHHFASDIISGALFGEAIGSSFGASFSQAFALPGKLTLLPRGQGGLAVQWLGSW